MELDNFGYLLGETARILKGRFDEYARANGVTHTQWMVLIALLRREGINQMQLAQYLEVEPISLCRMVDRLQAAGWVKRVENPKDRRIWSLHLTAAARKVLQRLRGYGAQVLAEMSQGISAAEIQQFVVTVSKFRANLLQAALHPVETTPATEENKPKPGRPATKKKKTAPDSGKTSSRQAKRSTGASSK